MSAANEYSGYTFSDYLLTSGAPALPADNQSMYLLFYIRTGAVLGGSVDIKRADWRRVS